MIYSEAEEFIKDSYWTETHDKASGLDVPSLVHEKLLKDNKEKDPEYYDHREGVVHTTSLTKCLRGVVLDMLGEEKDAMTDARKLGIFKAGNLFEDFIVDALGDKMLDRQTEYVYKYKGIILTGRDDGTMLHEGVQRVLENKSVHSDSFWHRQKEGTLVTAANLTQLQTYLWLRRWLPNVYVYEYPPEERRPDDIIYSNLSFEKLKEFRNGKLTRQIEKPNNDALNGVFCYISKDDCTIAQAPVKFNMGIIEKVVIPALDIVAEGYEKRDAMSVPVPPLTRFEVSKNQNQVNFVCKYCDHHNKCAGNGWLLEAQAEVKRKNAEMEVSMRNPFAVKKEKPVITVSTGVAEAIAKSVEVEVGGAIVEVSPQTEIKNNE